MDPSPAHATTSTTTSSTTSSTTSLVALASAVPASPDPASAAPALPILPMGTDPIRSEAVRLIFLAPFVPFPPLFMRVRVCVRVCMVEGDVVLRPTKHHARDGAVGHACVSGLDWRAPRAEGRPAGAGGGRSARSARGFMTQSRSRSKTTATATAPASAPAAVVSQVDAALLIAKPSDQILEVGQRAGGLRDGQDIELE